MALRVFTLLLLMLATCPEWAQSQASSGDPKSTTVGQVSIFGAGSTTINLLMQRWIEEYHRLHPEVRIEYQSIGSGGGIRQLKAGNISFGATEVPMTDEQLTQTKGRVLHLPISLRAVVPAYNLPQVPELRFSGNTLANIFLGKITMWDDPAIAGDNPGVNLPKMQIKVAHQFPRRDGSGTTFVAAHYLSNISTEFRDTLDKSDGQSWPVPTGMEGRSGGGWTVAAAVHKFPDSIGWVDLLALSPEHLQYAAVKSSDGEFVKATADSVTAAAAAALPFIQTKAPDFRVSITNGPGKAAYPVSTFMWMVLYDDDKDKKQHEALIDFLKWILTDGQKITPTLGYPPLPPELVEMELQRIVGTRRSNDAPKN